MYCIVELHTLQFVQALPSYIQLVGKKYFSFWMSVSFTASINEFLLVIPLHHIVFLCVPLFSYWFFFSSMLFQSCRVLNVYLYCVPLSMSIKNLHLCLCLSSLSTSLSLSVSTYSVFLFLSGSVMVPMPGHVFMLSSVSNRFSVFNFFSLNSI